MSEPDYAVKLRTFLHTYGYAEAIVRHHPDRRVVFIYTTDTALTMQWVNASLWRFTSDHGDGPNYPMSWLKCVECVMTHLIRDDIMNTFDPVSFP